ncbi:MAG: PAS domain S-box protein [Opitutaceae bacterium]|nr:PAS domain S-box protein [Opitutaceae bacterium]
MTRRLTSFGRHSQPMPAVDSPTQPPSEAFLAAIFDGCDDAIISKDLNGLVTSWNRAAERIFGYRREEMIGESVLKIIPDSRRHEEEQILNKLRRGDRIEHFETIRKRKDGSEINVSLTISPIRNEWGQVIGASKIARDNSLIQEAKHQLETHAANLESHVQERTLRLQESMAELEAFSYSLSHDMRAPLRAIQGYAELILEEEGMSPAETADYLRRIIAATTRMDRLIRDVLNFARFSRSEITVSKVDLEPIVDEIVRDRTELQQPHSTVQVERPLLPVLGHSASLTQCLTNLLDNAVKFMPKGRHPVVRVYTEEAADNHIRVCVADNGIGIDAEGQKRIFGIFERLNATTHYQGTGIGLAIVRRAAERMGGRAGVSSAPGLGSTFWIELSAP